MLARAKKARHKFLELPHEVQDEIIEKLDRRDLTEESAEELARSHGCDISGRSISRYYEALRRERGLQQRRERLEQNITALMPVDTDEIARMYMKLAVDMGAEAIMAAGGNLETLESACKSASSAIFAVAEWMRRRTDEKKAEAELMRLKRQETKGKGEKPMSEDEMLKWIRERVYGLGH